MGRTTATRAAAPAARKTRRPRTPEALPETPDMHVMEAAPKKRGRRKIVHEMAADLPPPEDHGEDHHTSDDAEHG